MVLVQEKSGHSTSGWGNLTNGALGVTCIYYAGILLNEADIKIATNVSFYVSKDTDCVNKYDYCYTMTHDFGHAVGMNHASQNNNQTMKPTQATCTISDRKLGDGDLNGIVAKY